MGDFKRLAHAVWHCIYHLIWCPKYRYRVMKGEVGNSIRDIIRQLCAWKKVEILAGNDQIDHIHLVVAIPPKYSVSKFVGFLKGKSAIKILDQYPSLKRRYLGRHFWAKGYCVSTVGLHESQLYAWRKKARYKASRSETEKALAAENVRLKRQVAKQAEELAILKKYHVGHRSYDGG